MFTIWNQEKKINYLGECTENNYDYEPRNQNGPLD